MDTNDKSLLRQFLDEEVKRRFLNMFQDTSGLHEMRKSIHLSIMRDVAEILQLPFTHCIPETCNGIECYILPFSILKKLNYFWNQLLASYDHQLSNEERSAREQFQARGCHVHTQDLIRYLGILFRYYSIPGQGNDKSQRILKTRDMNMLLAVDGFQGLWPSDFKHYLFSLKVSISPDEMDTKNVKHNHVRAVRAMYEFFECQEELSCLTGTDSACLVFLTLLQLYRQKCRVDDSIDYLCEQSRKYTEAVLMKNGNYYRDIRTVLVKIQHYMNKLESVYLEILCNTNQEEVLNGIATEKLNRLLCQRNSVHGKAKATK